MLTEQLGTDLDEGGIRTAVEIDVPVQSDLDVMIAILEKHELGGMATRPLAVAEVSTPIRS